MLDAVYLEHNNEVADMKEQYGELEYSELLLKHSELVEEFRKARYDAVVGHLDNPVSIRVLRRRLARAKTIVHEYELGIRQQ